VRAMTRVTEILDKSQLPESEWSAFDAITESRGGIVGPFPVLLNSPESARRVALLGHYLRFDSALPSVARELAILSAAREADCSFEWAAHVRLARQAGVREEAIEAIGQRAPAGSLLGEEAVVVNFARQLLREHRVSQAAYDAACAAFGERGVIDLTTLCGYYTMIACVLNAFEVLPREGSPALP
jgi:4-carboxymuconolactone decarboxylase